MRGESAIKALRKLLIDFSSWADRVLEETAIATKTEKKLRFMRTRLN